MFGSHMLNSDFNKRPVLLMLIVGHLANAPRAQKEAATARKAGFRVLIRGIWWNDRLALEDLTLATSIGVDFGPVVDLRKRDLSTFLLKLKQRLAREICSRFAWESSRALGIGGPEMLKEALRIKPDFTMVHFEAGLWVGVQLLQRGFRVGVDFEDWFSEDLSLADRKARPLGLLKVLERKLLRTADLTITTTHVLADALAVDAETSRVPVVMPNCFPWKKAPYLESGIKDSRSSAALSFYWFSQTIGPGRGLETLGRALTQVHGEWELNLRGNLRNYQTWFESAFPATIRNRVKLLAPVSNADLPLVSSVHDVGLALELPHCASRDLTATNKIFEYLRCGLAVIATQTAGQEEVMSACPDVGWRVPPGDVEALRGVLQNCIDNRDLVMIARARSLAAASSQWAWESFEGSLVDLLRKACSGDQTKVSINAIF
jgi:glycosyltransferase involved in cell wall biosynthesis